MTAINAMKFGDKSGGMVADSQSSTDLRKYDTSEKVRVLKSNDGSRILVGGTGASYVLHEATVKLARDFPNDKPYSVDQAVNGLYEILQTIRRDVIDKEMRGRFGFGAKEYAAGRLLDGTPIGQHLLNPAAEVYLGNDEGLRGYLGNAFLVVGGDNSGTSVHVVPMGRRPAVTHTPYAAHGSGMDESDKILHEFIRGLSRSERHNINPVKGMAALIRATNKASDFNQGVGGIPTVAYFDDKELVVLDENRSLLATEIVRVNDAGLIPSERAFDSLEKLIFSKNSELDIEKQVFLDDPKTIEIMRFLRGYRPNLKVY